MEANELESAERAVVDGWARERELEAQLDQRMKLSAKLAIGFTIAAVVLFNVAILVPAGVVEGAAVFNAFVCVAAAGVAWVAAGMLEL